MQGSYAIVPNRGKVYENLQPLAVNLIAEIANLQSVFGYISYECYNEIESITPSSKLAFCNFPQIHFSKFSQEKNSRDKITMFGLLRQMIRCVLLMQLDMEK